MTDTAVFDRSRGGAGQSPRPLDADAARNLTDRERFAHAAALTGDANAFENLNAFLFAFTDANVHSERVARAKLRDVVAQLLSAYLFHDIHRLLL